MIKAVLFDVDNTLLDFDAYVRESIKNGFREFGLGDYDDTMFDTFTEINNRLWRQIEQGSITYSALYANRWNLIFEALGVSFDGERFETYFREQLFDNAIPIDGAIKILRYLEGRYLLCVASNGPYEQQLNRLKVGGMLPFFSKCFISEKIGASKPSKAFFLHALSEINAELEKRGEAALNPKEILMVGDSLTSDIAGALGVGFQTCFFDKHQKGETGDLPIDHVIGKLEELSSFL